MINAPLVEAGALSLGNLLFLQPSLILLVIRANPETWLTNSSVTQKRQYQKKSKCSKRGINLNGRIYFISCIYWIKCFSALVHREALSNLLYMSNNLNDLYEEVLSFRDHLNKVYGMEMFYGDETLKAMLRHAKHLAALFDDYESILLLTQAEEDLEEDDDGDTEET